MLASLRSVGGVWLFLCSSLPFTFLCPKKLYHSLLGTDIRLVTLVYLYPLLKFRTRPMFFVRPWALGCSVMLFEAILDNRYDSPQLGNHAFGVTSLKRFYV